MGVGRVVAYVAYLAVVAVIGYTLYQFVLKPVRVRQLAEDHLQEAETLQQNVNSASRKSLEDAMGALKFALNRGTPINEEIEDADSSLASLITTLKSNPNIASRNKAGDAQKPEDVDFVFERDAYLIHTNAYQVEKDGEWSTEPFFGNREWTFVEIPPDAEGVVSLKSPIRARYHVDKQFGPYKSYRQLMLKVREVAPGAKPSAEFLAKKFGRQVAR